MRKVSAYGPEILLVAFGHKKQERWLVENKDKMQFGVAMGVVEHLITCQAGLKGLLGG